MATIATDDLEFINRVLNPAQREWRAAQASAPTSALAAASQWKPSASDAPKPPQLPAVDAVSAPAATGQPAAPAPVVQPVASTLQQLVGNILPPQVAAPTEDNSATARFNRAADIYRSMVPQYTPAQLSQSGREYEYQKARQSILSQIQEGLTTTTPGRRLTADGLRALNDTLTVLDREAAGSAAAQAKQLELEQQAGLARQNRDDAAARLQAQREDAQARLQSEVSRQRMASSAALLNTVFQDQRMRDQNFASVAANFFKAPELLAGTPAGEQYTQERMGAWANAATLLQQPDGGQKLNESMATLQSAFQQTADPARKAEIMRRLREFQLVKTAYDQQRALQSTSALGTIMASPVGMADGGIVPPASALQTPMMDAGLMRRYAAYTNVARSMGLPAVPLTSFASISSASTNNAPTLPTMMPQATPAHTAIMGYADGGVVASMLDGRQVDGKVVLDMNPTAETDSIPAIIDEQHPAKLDSGEMVIPKDVVMFFGTRAFYKMIEQARQAQGGRNGNTQ